MKKLILASALLIAGTGIFFGLQSNAPAVGNVCVGGTDYNATTYANIFATDLDSINGAAVQTYTMTAGCNPLFITYTNLVYKTAGTPTVTAACYAAADAVNYADAPIATFTVNPTSLTVPTVNTYIVNNPYGGNPNTTYKWAITNLAGGSVSCMSEVTIK